MDPLRDRLAPDITTHLLQAHTDAEYARVACAHKMKPTASVYIYIYICVGRITEECVKVTSGKQSTLQHLAGQGARGRACGNESWDICLLFS
jgi:hypothetical protein